MVPHPSADPERVGRPTKPRDYHTTVNARLSPSPLPLTTRRWVLRHGTGVTGLITLLGHLAIWVGLYAAGCVLAVGLLLGDSWPLRGMLIAGLTAVGTYLIDRSGRLDPADLAAHPDRAALMIRFRPVVRGLALVMLGLAMLLAAGTSLAAVLVVMGAPIGVLLYGHRRHGVRPKDRLLIKNGVVAVSMAMMALILAGDGRPVGATMMAGIFILLHVFADAMLCDLDDRQADADHGTRTIPAIWGEVTAWRLAVVIGLVAAGVLMIGAILGLAHWSTALLLGSVPLGATILIRIVSRARVKDLVDLAWPLAILLAAIGLAI